MQAGIGPSKLLWRAVWPEIFGVELPAMAAVAKRAKATTRTAIFISDSCGVVKREIRSSA